LPNTILCHGSTAWTALRIEDRLELGRHRTVKNSWFFAMFAMLEKIPDFFGGLETPFRLL
jgi:hypothetical protein